jgi:hypothetical protein
VFRLAFAGASRLWAPLPLASRALAPPGPIATMSITAPLLGGTSPGTVPPVAGPLLGFPVDVRLPTAAGLSLSLVLSGPRPPEVNQEGDMV